MKEYLKLVADKQTKCPQGYDVVPIEEWASEFLLSSSLRLYKPKAQWKRALTGRLEANKRPETRWANHEQVECRRKSAGGPHSYP